MESNDVKLIVYFFLSILFGPYLAVHFSFIGDYYSLSKIIPIFDTITGEWLLILNIFLFWLGLFFMLSFWNAFKKYQNKPPKLDWWQSSVLYQIYIRSFNDSNGDGVGDLRGVIKKLDYLKSIGVESIWLTPFYPSGGYDGGYDVTSFIDIDPVYGSMQDFDELVEQVHRRGMHILIDFIPNHTSDQHEWFKESCKSADKTNPYKDYYVWYPSENSVEPPNNWVSVFGNSAWEYNENRRAWYLHQFLKQQPDLNLRCPAVQEELKKVIRFWLETKKVDGMRIDALKHLFESESFQDEPLKHDVSDVSLKNLKYNDLDHIHTTNQEETFLLLNDWRSFCEDISKKVKKSKALIVEATYDNVKDLRPYYEYKNNKTAHFPFNFQMCSLRDSISFTPENLKKLVDDYVKNLPKKSWHNWQLGNHDISRISSRVGVEYIDIANGLNILLGGTPIIYYGEEIGMEDLPETLLKYEDCRDEFGRRHGPPDYLKYTRDLARTPMQWSSDDATSSEKSWLPLHPNYKLKNVQDQLEDSRSHLNIFRNLVELRKSLPVLQWGTLNMIKVDQQIISFTRSAYDFPTYLVVMNLSDKNVNANLLVSTDIAPRAYVVYYVPGRPKTQTKAETIDKETMKEAEMDLIETYKKGAAILTKNVFLKSYDYLIVTWYSTN